VAKQVLKRFGYPLNRVYTGDFYHASLMKDLHSCIEQDHLDCEAVYWIHNTNFDNDMLLAHLMACALPSATFLTGLRRREDSLRLPRPFSFLGRPRARFVGCSAPAIGRGRAEASQLSTYQLGCGPKMCAAAAAPSAAAGILPRCNSPILLPEGNPHTEGPFQGLKRPS
jgi:hypothetical protein